jgi:hypothetical protein
MAGPRRPDRGPGPLPEPLGSIVVDGSNVIASSRRRPIERLDLVEAWAGDWRPDLPVTVFVDWSTAVRCRPEAQAVLRARCEDVNPKRPRYVVVAAEAEADAVCLARAQQHRGLVLSNDRFFDHDDLRHTVVLVQFTIVGDVLTVADEATWFRGPGAERVPMGVLRERCAPAD